MESLKKIDLCGKRRITGDKRKMPQLIEDEENQQQLPTTLPPSKVARFNSSDNKRDLLAAVDELMVKFGTKIKHTKTDEKQYDPLDSTNYDNPFDIVTFRKVRPYSRSEEVIINEEEGTVETFDYIDFDDSSYRRTNIVEKKKSDGSLVMKSFHYKAVSSNNKKTKFYYEY